MPKQRIKDMKTLDQYPETIKGPQALVFHKNNKGRAGIATRIHYVDKRSGLTYCGLNPEEHFSGHTYAGAGRRVPICDKCFDAVKPQRRKQSFSKSGSNNRSKKF